MVVAEVELGDTYIIARYLPSDQFAVVGLVPSKHVAQGRTRSTKVILSQVKSALGFAFAFPERFDHAFSMSTTGRLHGAVIV